MNIEPNLQLELPAMGSWPAAHHLFEEESQWAVQGALAAGRPLLIRGEPGAGKSQLARAAAIWLGRAFVSTVVNARTHCEDLQYDYDAVARLGEAQTLAALGKQEKAEELLEPQRFLLPGPLWWVFDPQSAKQQEQKARGNSDRRYLPKNWKPQQGSVLLIDEIDKAEADLPNGLLETLGNGSFTIPHVAQPVSSLPGCPPPLVVITTNEERELPAAFQRRCLVLQLEPPGGDKLVPWLDRRGEVHFGGLCSQEVRLTAARQLVVDRERADKAGLPLPGQAEYLDLLRALSQVEATADSGREAKQLEVLAQLARFTLGKYRDQE